MYINGSLLLHSDAVVGGVTSFKEFIVLNIASAVAALGFSVSLLCLSKQKDTSST